MTDIIHRYRFHTRVNLDTQGRWKRSIELKRELGNKGGDIDFWRRGRVRDVRTAEQHSHFNDASVVGRGVLGCSQARIADTAQDG